jgi:phospho-N-acetylmuramoyl-pentapeptide-transferase
MIIADIVKVIFPAILSFIIGIGITPFVSDYLYRNKMWKKRAGKIAPDGRATPIFNELHKDKEINTPRMGGVIIWLSALLATLVVAFISRFLPSEISNKLDFLSRNQTWLPLFTLVLGSLFGLIDDYLEVKGGGDYVAGGLSLKKRLLIVALIGLTAGTWFYFKLDVNSLGLPGGYILPLGLFFIPFFAIVTMAIYSGGVIDGLDGLAGGIFSTMFTAYAGIAFYQQQINLAAFCLVVVGALLAFLWFNIPPARFYMSETGTMGLTVSLAVVAFMTDKVGHGYGVIALPIIAMPLVLTSLSVIIQLLSKKFRNGKKVFLVAPIHHHFEAIGWPSYKVTMRFWIIGLVFAILGVIFALVG